MKKLFLICVCLFSFAITVACNKTETTTNKKDPVTLKYACYRECGTKDTEARYPMVQAIREYERLNPHVTVEILRAPMVPNEDETGVVQQPWTDYLASLAATNKFPDLFNANSMPNVLTQGWAEDITSEVEKDETFNLMYDAFKTSGKFFDRYYAIPYMYEFFGYFVNNTLFDESNVDRPEFGITLDEMITLSKQVTRLQDSGSTLGMSGSAELFNYYPAQLNSDLGWYGYNSATGKFELSSSEFAKAIDLNISISKDKSHVNDALTNEERIRYFGSSDWWYPWWNSKLGLQFDFSVMFTNLINSKTKGEITFDFDFIGIPKGNKEEESRTPVKPSFMMVGKNTLNKAESYNLLKWLSFDPAGYEYKMKVSREVTDSLPIISPPLTTDARAHKAFFEDTYPDYPQWRKVIENGNFYFDLWAVLPGFEEARWLMPYKEGVTMADINIQIGVLGSQKIGDHAVEMARLMNVKISEVNEKLKKTLGIK